MRLVADVSPSVGTCLKDLLDPLSGRIYHMAAG